jgi:hypothetical protein
MMMVNRNLIRHILKEETEDSDINTKGIDIAIKLIKKSYPYIIGWQLNQDDKFTIYIDIICDTEKLKEFYDSDLKVFYLEHEDELHKDKLSYAPSALKISETMVSDQKHEEYIKMKQELNEMYQMLPDYLVIKDKYMDPKELYPDKFMYR